MDGSTVCSTVHAVCYRFATSVEVPVTEKIFVHSKIPCTGAMIVDDRFAIVASATTIASTR